MARKRKGESLEEIEKLQRENKSLRTINRSLLRHLKKLDRGFKFSEPNDDDIEEDFVDNTLCKECNKGNVIEVNLGVKRFYRCELCSWRSKAETVKK